MPSKRQPSKQRRAAQNRATREALAARTEHAAGGRQRTSSSSSAGGSSSGSGRGGGLLSGLFGGGGGGGGGLFGGGGSGSGGGGGGLFGGGGSGGGGLFGGGRSRVPATPVNIVGAGPGGKTPGKTAVTVALGFAVLSFALYLLQQVPVDDRDEALPYRGQLFRAVYLDARSLIRGRDIDAHSVSIFEAYGPAVLIYGVIPLLIVVAVYVAFRRSPSSRPLTFGMLGLAALMFVAPQAVTIVTIAALVAVAVGSFQARRVEMALRMAEQAGQEPAAADEDDEDVDEDEDFDDEYEDDSYDEDDEYDEEDEDLDEYEDEGDEEEDLDEEDVADEEALDDGDDGVADEDEEGRAQPRGATDR